MTLVKDGHEQSQSAALRAFIKRYIEDKALRDMIGPYIEQEKIYCKNRSKISLL